MYRDMIRLYNILKIITIGLTLISFIPTSAAGNIDCYVGVQTQSGIDDYAEIKECSGSCSKLTRTSTGNEPLHFHVAAVGYVHIHWPLTKCVGLAYVLNGDGLNS